MTPKICAVHSIDDWLPLTQTWVHSQVAALGAGGDAHVVCDRTSNLDQFAIPNLHCYDREGRLRHFSDRIVRKLLGRRELGFRYRQARRLRPAVWHSHFADQAWYDREIVESCRARHVLSVYGADISQAPGRYPWNERVPEILGQVDLVLCEGAAMVRQVTALGCPPERAVVHHLGVTLEHIPFQPRSWRPGTPLRVLIAGTFREKKGIPYALEALARIDHKVELEVTLIGDAAGKAGDADEKARIVKLLERTGLSCKTRWLGFQPYAALLEEGRSHHVFLSPSVQAADGDNEGGSPVVITEMAASGMLIVSSRHCDIPEVIVDGVGGLLADERDVDGLAAQLGRLIENPHEWLPMQLAARAHIEREYSVQIQAQRLAAIYERLVNPQPARRDP